MTQPTPKFSDLMDQGAAQTTQLFYNLFHWSDDEPLACALGCVGYARATATEARPTPYEVELALDQVTSEADLNQLVTLRRAEFPDLFADLEREDFVDESEDKLRWNLVQTLIPRLNDALQYPVPKIAAIVRQLGY